MNDTISLKRELEEVMEKLKATAILGGIEYFPSQDEWKRLIYDHNYSQINWDE